ncbi:MAG: thiamine pyrophosphate-binding protein [Dehalobacter sp.]|nr:thiamine pyrophosphate-binding protein [Dehalobacter sp.]
MIKVSDYITNKILELGVRHVFMITGGGAMHLNDSVGRCKDMEFICNHHEQASAIAVEGYARITGRIGVAIVTTGPGGTNTITGVLGQWQDSIPALYISGQVRYGTTVASTGLPLRQLGDQEVNITEIVRSITKYSVMVNEPLSIRYHFEKAVHLATTGRPGPVWLDIPLDVQAAYVDEKDLYPFEPDQSEDFFDKYRVECQVEELLERIRNANRPVILAGSGIRTGHTHEDFLKVIERLNIPVLTAWNSHDLLYEEHPLYFGRPGTVGDRAGNFILQNSDLLISIGCRLNIRQIGYTYKAFAREAFRAVVDIDPAELKKPTIFPDMAVHSDAKYFIDVFLSKLGLNPIQPKTEWISWCGGRKNRYPVVLPEYYIEKDYVNPYAFIGTISDVLEEKDIIVAGNGAACVVTFQAIRLKNGQRLLGNSGTASMGYDLPVAIGACVANDRGRVICFAGDGSIQMNIQELQTIVYNKLPVKIFVFSNGGYLSIRTTQTNYFNGFLVGESDASGVGFPDMVKVAQAYGINANRISSHADMADKIKEVLKTPGPFLCDVAMSQSQMFLPRVSSQKLPDGTMVSKPLEDMYPFLDRREFLDNMLIPEWKPD